MNEKAVEIGAVQINSSEIKKYWVDGESGDERKNRLYNQENNYLGSVFSMLVAGLISTYLLRKKSPAKKYLHIKTESNEYCFSEDEININEALGKLN
ncbi:hypothetical protein [Chitinibacter sp. S2-10]|uniref:hypothetical protein n=1 Tax=Chitinibacter sp. S2-10 TaxID=3373597 RepID=UPI0039775F1A